MAALRVDPKLRVNLPLIVGDDDDTIMAMSLCASNSINSINSFNSLSVTLLMQICEEESKACIQNYVEEVVPMYNSAQFREHFQMSTGAFEELLCWIAPSLPKCRTISVEKKLLATLWYLGNTETYRSVADRFGLTRGSLHKVVSKVCGVLAGNRQEWIRWPSTINEMHRLADQFAERCDFPGVVAAIDGTHIEIPGPSNFRDAYINRSGYPSMQLQVACSKDLLFLDVFTGWPGSVHDARVYRNSQLGEKLAAEGLPLGFHLIGDSAYPLLDYMMVPFRNNGHMDAVQKQFNKAHSSTRVDVERAIGLLKGKWRKLKFLDMTSTEYMSEVIKSACVLHNYVVLKQGVDEDDMEAPPAPNQEVPEQGHIHPTAQDKRMTIAHQLM